MMFTLRTPAADELELISSTVSAWQSDAAPVRVHPGDLGWFALHGAAATASAIRLWCTGERIVALALLDGPQLLRFAMDPAFADDAELASRIAADVSDAEAGVLETGAAVTEARGLSALGTALAAAGWEPDEPWTPLHLDLSEPAGTPAPSAGAPPVNSNSNGNQTLRIVELQPEETEDWARVHWSAFKGTTITEGGLRKLTEGWQKVATETPFAESARILGGLDEDGRMAAVVAVWSAGPGRPGLIEPMGVHQNHRGRGFGREITAAGASALREMGASSAFVCAEAANQGALATYVSAGFTAAPDVRDWARPD